MKVVVIGAGPCGIMSSIEIKKNHPEYEVVLLEKDTRGIGSRIKVSGNGRCNLGNTNINPKKYNHPNFVEDILSLKEDLFSYFEEGGLGYFSDEEGRIYPLSESSLSVIHVLNNLLTKYGVKVELGCNVLSIEKQGDKYQVLCEKTQYFADKIILSIGGISLNNDKNIYYSLLEDLDVKITQLNPSLTPIMTSKFDKRLEGKRTKVNVRLFRNGDLVKIEDGELLFKKDGVSGIVMFNMSSYLSRLHVEDYSDYYFIIDLLPKISYHEYLKYRSIDPSLKNILHEDIAREIVNKGIDPKEMLLEIKGLYDFKNSQVTCGGVDLEELNSNLSLKKDNNIFIGGETIDIDGECGGYNIEFAFLSGIKIGRSFNE